MDLSRSECKRFVQAMVDLGAEVRGVVGKGGSVPYAVVVGSDAWRDLEPMIEKFGSLREFGDFAMTGLVFHQLMYSIAQGRFTEPSEYIAEMMSAEMKEF